MNYINLKQPSIRLNLDVLLILTFLFCSLSEGLVPKLTQFLIFIIMFMRTSKYINLAEKKTKNRIILLSFLPIVLFFVQLNVLELNSDQIRYLFGITKNLYIGIIIFLIARNYFKKIDNYMAALSLFLIYLNLGTLTTILANFVSIDSRVSFLSFASTNYAVALSTICVPIYFYYFTFFKRKNKWSLNLLNNISIIICFLAVILSGSRANIFFWAVEIVVIFFLIKKDFVYFLKSFSFFVIIYFVVMYLSYAINGQILDLLNRGVSVFSSVEDYSRELLWNASSIQFENSNKLLGSGSIIVQYYQKEAHNFIWEILLCGGKIGLGIYIIYTMNFVWSLLCEIRNIDRIYIMLTLLVAYGIGYVQPFITTGYTFSILMWASIIVISFSGGMKRLDEK